MNNKKNNSRKLMFLRILICILIVVSGVLLMIALGKMKKPPEKKVITQKAISVETVTASFEDVNILVTGFGEVKSLTQVSIAPEVSGKIIYVNPNLKIGGIIKKGETLFKVDQVDYRNAVTTYTNRLKTLKRTMVLSKKEYLRTKTLFEKSSTGTLSDVESSEQTYNSAKDQVDQIEDALLTAKLNLKRCTLITPFTARISEVEIEKNQYISKGTKAVTINDDSVLEVQIPISGIDAKKYLGYKNESVNNFLWFKDLVKKPCEVIWTGDNKTISKGTVERIIKFDSSTRTVYVAVRIHPEDQKGSFPIVDGMFVKVNIPGKTVKNVIKVPRDAVSIDNTVYLSINGKLKTKNVKIIKTDDDYALISSGINPGDIVVTSKLVSPLENALLNIHEKSLLAQRSKGEK